MEKKPLLAYISIGVAALLFIGAYFVLSAPSGFPSEGVLFEIEEGRGLRGVSRDLKEKEVIRSRLAFEAFVILYGGEKRIRMGYYMFEDRVPVFEAARRIARGDRNLEPVKVTLPEGFTSLEMADVLVSKLPDFEKEKFLALADGKEGYLFPDTYFFFPGENADIAVEHLKINYEKKIGPLRSSFGQTGRTEAEIITMASVIEREAKGDDDRNVISGILWKRISLGMPLQADAAPETYEEKGLPEKPIANPGLLSIRAAIEPKESPYLFYLHDKNGIIHYARNFEEHKSNIAKYLK